MVIVQVRLNSSRLPNKATLQLGEYSLLEWVLLRLLNFESRRKIVLATSKENRGNSVEELAKKYSVRIYSGSEEDVVSRFCDIAMKDGFGSDYFRVCADNPFISPHLMRKMTEQLKSTNYDVIHSMQNLDNSKFIDGLGSELISKKAMKQLAINHFNLDEFDREHVTSHFYRNSNSYKVHALKCEEIYYQPQISLDVDTEEDYRNICAFIKDFNITPESADDWIIEAALDSGRFTNHFC
jgi:spore coat polysaccharide biosynthesis protein SpsF